MPVHEDVKRKSEEAGGDAGSQAPSEDVTGVPGADEQPRAGGVADEHSLEGAPDDDVDEIAPVGADSPTQLGTQRFVYAAYFAGAIGVAFLVSKLLEFGWQRLQSYRPEVGDPRDEILMPLSGLVGLSVAFYYWRRTRARQLAEEVATEMAKVTWPSRTEVTNGTVVVIVTTIVSTVFFALMDKFWGFVTNLVYGGT
jgi:preprotein translocase subunit SecE